MLWEPDLDFFAFWDSLWHIQWWYVWMGLVLKNARFTTQYIGRYTKRPAIAESRIKEYDGTSVTFEYQDKKEKIHRIVSLPVEDFIGRLIRHIPEKHFRMIRYSGIFSNRTRGRDMPIARILLKLHQGKKLSPLTWRQRRIAYQGIDPLICPHCEIELSLVEIVVRSRDGPKTIHF